MSLIEKNSLESATEQRSQTPDEIKSPTQQVDKIIFYPGYGVCHYLNSDSKYHYFKSLILQIKISIPIKTSAHRSLMTTDQALVMKEKLDLLKECSFSEVWNKRKKYFMNRIYTGQPEKILEVVQELNFVKTKKELSYSEKEIHKMAKNLLLDEITAVLT